MNLQSSADKSTWWWLYFAVGSIIWFASLFIGAHSPLSFLLSVFSGIGLVGLWGYLRSIAVGWRELWIGYFSLVMAGSAFSFGYTIWQSMHSDAGFFLGLLLIGAALSTPQWIALWRYAFRSQSIWQASAAA